MSTEESKETIMQLESQLRLYKEMVSFYKRKEVERKELMAELAIMNGQLTTIVEALEMAEVGKAPSQVSKPLFHPQ